MSHDPKDNVAHENSLASCLIRRLFVVGAFSLMIGAVVHALVRRDAVAFVFVGLSIPLFAIAVCMVLSTLAFPFEFSSLGRLKRCALPSEAPVHVWRGSWGVIGQLRAQLGGVSWTIFPSGLGIQIHLVGTGFLPWADVERLERSDPKTIAIHHRAADLRSPIVLPSDLERRSQWTIRSSAESKSA